MAKKRDSRTRSGRLLHQLVLALEADGDFPRQHDAVLALLAAGPLHCDAVIAAERASPTPDPYVGLELLAILRWIVGSHSGAFELGRIALTTGGPRPRPIRRGVPLTVAGPFRDVAVLQLLLILQHPGAGLETLRRCGAPDCGRIFVKHYRMEYCSTRCQKRVQARRLRRESARGPVRRVPPDRDLPVSISESARPRMAAVLRDAAARAPATRPPTRTTKKTHRRHTTDG